MVIKSFYLCLMVVNDKDGVQVGLKAGLSLTIFLRKEKRKFEFKVKIWWLVGKKKQFLGLFRSNEGL